MTQKIKSYCVGAPDVGGHVSIFSLPELSSHSSEYNAFIARTSGLDATHQSAYADLIDGLVSDGIWAKLDLLHIYATQDSTTALLNLISSSYNGTANGSPTFTADRGFTGTSGSTTKYISSGASPPLSQFTIASAHASFWSVTNAAADNNAVCGSYNAFGFGTFLVPRYGDGNAYMRINSQTGVSYSNATSNGHYIANKSSTGHSEAYKNGASQATSTSDTTSDPAAFGPFYSLAGNNQGTANGTNHQLAMYSLGSSLSSTDATNFYNRLRTFMTVVGVP